MFTSLLVKIGLAALSVLPVERIFALVLNKALDKISPANIEKARKTAEHLAELSALFNDILADKSVSTDEVTELRDAIMRARERLLAAWSFGADAKSTQVELAKTGLVSEYVEPVAKAAGCLVLCLCLFGAVGCKSMISDKQAAQAADVAKAYYEAPNVAQLWVIENTNTNQVCEFKVSNFTRFEMNTPVPPKNIIPREPTFWEGLWDTAKTLGPWAFFYGALQSGGFGNHTTVNNNGAAAQ